jgi:hypothetical protein
MRNPVRQCVGFSRSGPGDDEKWWSDRPILPHAILNGSALFPIEPV